MVTVAVAKVSSFTCLIDLKQQLRATDNQPDSIDFADGFDGDIIRNR